MLVLSSLGKTRLKLPITRLFWFYVNGFHNWFIILVPTSCTQPIRQLENQFPTWSHVFSHLIVLICVCFESVLCLLGLLSFTFSCEFDFGFGFTLNLKLLYCVTLLYTKLGCNKPPDSCIYQTKLVKPVFSPIKTLTEFGHIR